MIVPFDEDEPHHAAAAAAVMTMPKKTSTSGRSGMVESLSWKDLSVVRSGCDRFHFRGSIASRRVPLCRHHIFIRNIPAMQIASF